MEIQLGLRSKFLFQKTTRPGLNSGLNGAAVYNINNANISIFYALGFSVG